MDQKNFDEAIEILHSLLEIDSTNKIVQRNLLYQAAKVSYDSNRSYSAAIRYVMQVLEIDPTFYGALFIKAKAYFELKLYCNSLAECEAICKLDLPNDVRLTVLKLKSEIESLNGKENSTFNSRYSAKTNERVDNRKFFENLSYNKRDQKSSTNENASNAAGTTHDGSADSFFNANGESNEPRPSTQYSFTSSDNKNNGHFKEFVGKPKAPKKSHQQQQNEIQANAKNADGCREFKAKRFENAIGHYSTAIALDPTNAVYLANRSGCYIALDKLQLASADALKAIEIDASYWKGYSRAINCFLALGDIKLAEDYVAKFENNVAGVDSIKYNEIPKLESLKKSHVKILKFYDEKNFEECLKHLETSLQIAHSCTSYRNLKVECLLMLGKSDEADKIIIKVLQNDPRDVNIIFMQGLKFYYMAKIEDSISKFLEAIKLDPDFKKALTFRMKAMKMLNHATEGKIS